MGYVSLLLSPLAGSMSAAGSVSFIRILLLLFSVSLSHTLIHTNTHTYTIHHTLTVPHIILLADAHSNTLIYIATHYPEDV